MKLNNLFEEEKSFNVDSKKISLIFKRTFGDFNRKSVKLGPKDLQLIASGSNNVFEIKVHMTNIKNDQWLLGIEFDVKKLLQDSGGVVLEDEPTMSLYSLMNQKIRIGDFEGLLQKHFKKIEKKLKSYKKIIHEYARNLR